MGGIHQTPFGCLLRLFVVRMFHGGAEAGAEELDIGVGATLSCWLCLVYWSLS